MNGRLMPALELWRHDGRGRRVAVPLAELRREMIELLDVLRLHWRRKGLKALRITSTTDGVHSRESFHYLGLALDIARDGLPLGIAQELADGLGPSYQVIIESDHIHIEFDPRGHMHRLRTS